MTEQSIMKNNESGCSNNASNELKKPEIIIIILIIVIKMVFHLYVFQTNRTKAHACVQVQWKSSVFNSFQNVKNNNDGSLRLCKLSFYQLCSCRRFAWSACKSLAYIFVFIRLDYCNSLLQDINNLQLDMLQSELHVSVLV